MRAEKEKKIFHDSYESGTMVSFKFLNPKEFLICHSLPPLLFMSNLHFCKMFSWLNCQRHWEPSGDEEGSQAAQVF